MRESIALPRPLGVEWRYVIIKPLIGIPTMKQVVITEYNIQVSTVVRFAKDLIFLWYNYKSLSFRLFPATPDK